MESGPLHRPAASVPGTTGAPSATVKTSTTVGTTAKSAVAAAAAAAAASAALAADRRARATTREWSADEDTRLVEAVKAFGGKNWKGIAALVSTRDFMQCNQRWRKSLRPGLTKGTWTSDEDNQLRTAIHQHGCNSWRAVAELVDGRNTKQCKERWCKYLDPTINMGAWTPEEDLALMDSYARHKGRWAHIAADIEGRTDNMVKVRYKSLVRRHVKKQKQGSSPKTGSRRRGSENGPKRMSAATAVAKATVTGKKRSLKDATGINAKLAKPTGAFHPQQPQQSANSDQQNWSARTLQPQQLYPPASMATLQQQHQLRPTQAYDPGLQQQQQQLLPQGHYHFTNFQPQHQHFQPTQMHWSAQHGGASFSAVPQQQQHNANSDQQSWAAHALQAQLYGPSMAALQQQQQQFHMPQEGLPHSQYYQAPQYQQMQQMQQMQQQPQQQMQLQPIHQARQQPEGTGISANYGKIGSVACQ